MTWNDTKSTFSEQTDVPADEKLTASEYNDLVAFLEERQAWSQTTETADYTASDEDAVWADASSNAVTVTLPAPAADVRVAVIAVDATNAVTVEQNASEGINDATGSQSSITLGAGEGITVESDGNTWWVTASSGGGGTDTRTDVSDDGLTVVSETEDINFGTDLDVTDDGDNTVTVDATGSTSSGVEVEDDDSTVVADATTLNFGTDLGATDAGSGQATLSYTGSSQSTSLVGQLSSGNIVGIYEGGNVTTDPSNTTTPVQDTIDALNASSGVGGVIYLPGGVIQEDGPLRELWNKRLTGLAASQATQNRGSVIEFTHGGHGLALDGWTDTNHVTLDNLALRPHDSTDGRSAIRLYDVNADGSTANGRMFNMRNITLRDWVNTADDDGIIGVHEPHLYSCHWDNLFIRKCQGNGIGGSATSMFNFLEISNYLYSPDDDAGAVSQGQSAISTNPGTITSMQAKIGYLNIGRAAKKAIHLHNQTANGRIVIGSWNFEPTELASVNNPVFDVGGPGHFQSLTGKVTGTDVDSVFALGFNNDNNILGQPRLGNSTVTNNIVYVYKDSNGPSWYFGSTSDVSNDGSASNVRCLASAGTQA